MNKGITLIELLVVLAVIFIITGVIVVNPGKSRVNLDNVVREFVSDVRLAQNKAMSVETQGGDVPVSYGLQLGLNPDHYSVWYRIPPNTVHFKMVYPYKKGVTIIQPNTVTNIVFRVPDGAACIYDSIDCSDYIPDYDLGTIDVVFQASDGSTKTVTITSAGLVEIQ